MQDARVSRGKVFSLPLFFFYRLKFHGGILQAPSAAALSNTNNLKETFFILQQAIQYSVSPRLYRSLRDDRTEDGLLFLRVQRINTISQPSDGGRVCPTIAIFLIVFDGRSLLVVLTRGLLIFKTVVCLLMLFLIHHARHRV